MKYENDNVKSSYTLCDFNRRFSSIFVMSIAEMGLTATIYMLFRITCSDCLLSLAFKAVSISVDWLFLVWESCAMKLINMDIHIQCKRSALLLLRYAHLKWILSGKKIKNETKSNLQWTFRFSSWLMTFDMISVESKSDGKKNEIKNDIMYCTLKTIGQ